MCIYSTIRIYDVVIQYEVIIHSKINLTAIKLQFTTQSTTKINIVLVSTSIKLLLRKNNIL